MKENMVIGNAYFDNIIQRLRDDFGNSHRGHLLHILLHIIRHLKWESFECEMNAKELAHKNKMQQSDMSKCLKELETIGAIYRIKTGRGNTICINPEGAYYGRDDMHGQTVERFRLAVMDSD